LNLIFKKLSECNIQDIITAWNRGFEGYFVKIEMTPETFFQRMVNEGLSMELSLVIFDENEPIAIVINGVRTLNGKKTVWNGGTGIAPAYRGKGVSKRLMEETLRVYEGEGVEVATLEAIAENERAIRLYQKYSYEIVDSLVYLNGFRELPPAANASIEVKSLRPEQLPFLSFYQENVQWQCQWQSVKSGEVQVYYDRGQQPLGYTLFKRVWNQDCQLEKVFIYQLQLLCEVNREIMDAVFANICSEASSQVSFMTINAPVSNPAIQFLMKHGFTKSVEQVQMVKKINS
jgi:GNAT superfamily N-acetyltransferase